MVRNRAHGHSMILRVNIGGIKILLGGDLNIPAENFLLEKYAEIKTNPVTYAKEEQLLSRAGYYYFEADFARACHHGSSDFTETLLRAVNALATVVSSGDNEPRGHPRPDSLGALGKYGRGHRPLIFSAELARLYDIKILNPYQLYSEIESLQRKIDSAKSTQEKKDKAVNG